MKQHINSTKDKTKGKIISKKKHLHKPWIFSYKIIDVAYLPRWYKREINTWYEEPFSKYLSVGHALQQLNKNIRSYWIFSKNKYAGQEIRLINQDTNEVVELEVKNNEVIIKQKL